MERPGEGPNKQCFRQSRKPLKEHMTTRQQGNQETLDGLVLSYHPAVDGLFDSS